MTLWQYVKSRMEEHAKRIALEDGTTYGELIAYIETRAKRYCGAGRLVCVSGRSRIAHAVEIVSVLASGNVVVPVDACYGEKRQKEIEATIAQDDKKYPELAFIMFTSGTGGKSKGVMLSHENVTENLKMVETYFDVSPEDKILIARPLVHIAVIVGEFLYGLCRGATVAFYEEPFQPLRLFNALTEKGSTVLCGTPTMFRHLASVCRGRKFAPQKCVLSGELLSATQAEAFERTFPAVSFYNVYGLTEHSPRVSALLPQDFLREPGSVGKPLCGVQTKIQDGELLVKSPCVMQGYYNDERRTNAKIQDGWLHTGDMAHVDRDGYLYIDGRKDNMIIRSGLNIYPEEIENIAKACEGVENCIAYGENNETEGQIICLIFTGDASVQQVRRYLAAHAEPHLMPRKIEKADRLPTTPSGKTVRIC